MKLTNLFYLLALVFVVGLTSCGDDECENTCPEGQVRTEDCNCVTVDPCAGTTCPEGQIVDADCNCVEVGGGTETVVLSGEISDDMTLTSDKYYELAGKVYFTGGTLTINPGTIIKGREGLGTNASALVIARGSKINACGTADEPIIFTSVLDNIKVGETSGSNLNQDNRELWGGLIVLGGAPISAKDGDTETQIEGIPADETYGIYGGDNAADNSGSLCYISIRHGGALIGDNNEINGLTLGGVGNGTTINNIEVVGNLDDGVEFFGGTVDATNILVAYQGDDAIDLDMNYSGTIDNVYIIHGGDDTDEAFEIDGPENSTYKDGQFTILNATAIAVDTEKTSGADLKSKAQGLLKGVSWSGYKVGKGISVRANFDTDNNCADKSDAYQNVVANKLMVMSCEYVSTDASAADVAKVYTDKKADNAAELAACLDATDFQTVLDNAIVDGGNTISASITKGANTSVFSWTWSAKNGLVQ